LIQGRINRPKKSRLDLVTLQKSEGLEKGDALEKTGADART
jgi:hypothetical protein